MLTLVVLCLADPLTRRDHSSLQDTQHGEGQPYIYSMPASIPNDIYQFTTLPAFNASHDASGPPAAFLTRHGTHGIGFFGHASSPRPTILYLLDSVAYELALNGSAYRATQSDTIPFVMVTVFQPTYCVQAPFATRDTVLPVVTKIGQGMHGGKNSYMPFRIKGFFKTIQLGVEGKSAMLRTLEDVQGTLFGYMMPAWTAGISGKGMRCVFLDDGKRNGGYVVEFEAGPEAQVEWAICGRFHLGLPSGESWEALDLRNGVSR
ncbi:hypothetical protein MRB53_039525 [Persea americana]|nr:hypothetical protein MRB53_039525 [Persea americana]